MVVTSQQRDTKEMDSNKEAHLAVLSELAESAPESVILAASAAMRVAVEDQAKVPFVARALLALTRLTEVSTKRSLLAAAGAASDTMVLLQALESPEVLAEIGEGDPLLESRIRGALARRWLLHEEGGVCSAELLGRLLGRLSRQAIDKRRRGGKLIALDLGRHGYGYPIWQIHNGTVLPGFEQVIAVLHESDPWTQAGFMLTPNSWLGGDTP